MSGRGIQQKGLQAGVLTPTSSIQTLERCLCSSALGFCGPSPSFPSPPLHPQPTALLRAEAPLCSLCLPCVCPFADLGWHHPASLSQVITSVCDGELLLHVYAGDSEGSSKCYGMSRGVSVTPPPLLQPGLGQSPRPHPQQPRPCRTVTRPGCTVHSGCRRGMRVSSLHLRSVETASLSSLTFLGHGRNLLEEGSGSWNIPTSS